MVIFFLQKWSKKRKEFFKQLVPTRPRQRLNVSLLELASWICCVHKHHVRDLGSVPSSLPGVEVISCADPALYAFHTQAE